MKPRTTAGAFSHSRNVAAQIKTYRNVRRVSDGNNSSMIRHEMQQPSVDFPIGTPVDFRNRGPCWQRSRPPFGTSFTRTHPKFSLFAIPVSSIANHRCSVIETRVQGTLNGITFFSSDHANSMLYCDAGYWQIFCVDRSPTAWPL